MPTHQFFLLDSNATGYAAALTALASATSTNRGYTVTQVLRSASHDATIKIVCAYVDESDLTDDAANLAIGVYPNALCCHRFRTLTSFRESGFHLLGESVRSHEAVAGRTYRYIRPQQGMNAEDDDYGNGDGTTHQDAYNGPQDPDIADGGLTESAEHQSGVTYSVCEGAHVRFGNAGNGGNIDFGNGIAQQGQIAVATASAGAANAIRVVGNDEIMPGGFWRGYTLWERNGSSLAWELYDTGIYVHGKFQQTASGQNIGTTAVLADADVEDFTIDEDTLRKRHFFKGHTALADLAGTTGRCRYHAQRSGFAQEDWDAVRTYNGTSFTDVTAAANSATAGDWTALPISAPDDSAVYFISDDQFSTIAWSGTAGAAGTYTGVWEYSKGSGIFAQFTGIDDDTAAFSAGGDVSFNPKSDWATDTVDGVTGYVVRWRKTGGAVTTAATGTQARKERNAVFIHRWNDAAPTRGMCTGSNGLRHVLTGKSNFEYVNMRLAADALWTDMRGASGLTVTGTQLIPYADLQLGSDDMTVTFRASQTDKGQAVWWDITDMRVQDKTNQLIVDILAHVATLGGDTTKFDNLPEWSDIVGCINGPYPGVSGGRWNPITIQGLRIRKVGMMLDLMNDTDAIDLWVNNDPTDHHSFAMRGNQDAAAFTLEQLGFEDFLRAIETYAPATGNNDAPVSGSSSACNNWKFHYGYHHTHNGMTDSGQPTAGFVFSGDNDRGKYDDGTGGDSGNEVKYWGFKGINNDTDAAGAGISNSAEEPVTCRGIVFDGCRWAISIGRSAGPDSCNAITETTGPTYNDITANVMDSGNTATNLFATGAAGDILNLGVSVRVLRRFGFTITTAGVGAPTLAWEYRKNDSTWAAAANLSDGTSGLTVTGSVTLDRPTDAATLAIDGKTCWWARCRIVSGSFSTIPQASEISSRTIGASIDIDTYTVKNIVKGILLNATNDFTNNSSVIKDDNATIVLSGAQTSSDNFYKIASTSLDTPDQSLAGYQARTKSKTNTAAEQDSVFGPNHTIS